MASAVIAPLFGVLIAATGYTAAFALLALAPVAAIPLVPRDTGYLPKNGVSTTRETPISGK